MKFCPSSLSAKVLFLGVASVLVLGMGAIANADTRGVNSSPSTDLPISASDKTAMIVGGGEAGGVPLGDVEFKGKVGIGTSTPTTALDVRGDLYVSGSPYITVTSCADGQVMKGISNGQPVCVNSVGVLSGVLNDGDQIPLPEGFTQSQCQWIVSPHYVQTAWSDHTHYIKCLADENRYVFIRIVDEGNGPGSANYMIVCR